MIHTDQSRCRDNTYNIHRRACIADNGAPDVQFLFTTSTAFSNLRFLTCGIFVDSVMLTMSEISRSATSPRSSQYAATAFSYLLKPFASHQSRSIVPA